MTRYVFRPRDRAGLAESAVRTISVRYSEQETKVLQICISSQLGCAVRCSFCNYGERFFGQLNAEEIAAQAFLIKVENDPKLPDVCQTEYALLGGGEPLHNFDAVESALLQISNWDPAARLTLSTSTPVRNARVYERLLHLGARIPSLNLQLSCHATEDHTRRRIIPTPTLPIARVAELGERWLAITGRRPVVAFAAQDHYDRRDWARVQGLALAARFDPHRWELKITPVFPYENTAVQDAEAVRKARLLFDEARAAGFSCATLYNPEHGWEIGANCGQFPDFLDYARSRRDTRRA